jgi:hypothetical protein
MKYHQPTNMPVKPPAVLFDNKPEALVNICLQQFPDFNVRFLTTQRICDFIL